MVAFKGEFNVVFVAPPIPDAPFSVLLLKFQVLTVPPLVTLAIFTFFANWNDLFWPIIIIRTKAHYTLPLTISSAAHAFSAQCRLLGHLCRVVYGNDSDVAGLLLSTASLHR